MRCLVNFRFEGVLGGGRRREERGEGRLFCRKNLNHQNACMPCKASDACCLLLEAPPKFFLHIHKTAKLGAVVIDAADVA